MSFLVGEIVARITADTSSFDKAIDETKRKGEGGARSIEKDFDKIGDAGDKSGRKIANRFNITRSSIEMLGSQMRRTGAIMTASLTAPIVMGMRSAVREAALLEGAMAKFDVVFGAQARETEEWVNQFRRGVPLARREIVQAAASMQDLLIPMGVAREDATEMTKEWLELAAALAAFNDVPVSQALDAIRSGIAGQSRPLRDLGINASVAAIEQTALSEGLMKAGEQMTDQVRQQALLIRAYEQRSDAVNGYEDQLGSTLMAEQELQATFKDTLATFGQDLQPMYQSVTESVTGLLRRLNEMDDAQRQNIIRAAGWVAALGPGLTILGQLVRMLPMATKGMIALNAAMRANPILAVVGALAGLSIVIMKIETRIRSFRSELEELMALDPHSATIEDLEEMWQKYDVLEDKLKSTKELHEQQGWAGTQASREVIDAIKDEMSELEDKMDLIDRLLIIQKDNSKEAVEANDKVTESIERTRKAIERVRVAMDKPEDDVVDPMAIAEANREAEILAMSIEELIDSVDVSIPDKLFPPGSLGELQQHLQELQQQMLFAFDPEVQARLREEMEQTQQKMDEITGSTRKAKAEGQEFGNIMGNALSQAVLHGNNLGDVLSNLIKQFASRAFVTGIAALVTGGASLGGGSFIGAVFGGLFHGGGVIPGRGERTIRARGGEMVLTENQQRALGNMQSGGGSRVINVKQPINVQVDNETVFRAVQNYQIEIDA